MVKLLKRPVLIAGALVSTGLLAAAQGSWNAPQQNFTQPNMPQGSMAAPNGAQRMMAMPGTVNYVEGQANINGEALPSGPQSMNTKVLAGETLSTGMGSKAEMLLMPGVVLRIGDNSALRMVSPMLTNAQVDLTRGTAILEVGQIGKEARLAVSVHGADILLERKGLYMFNADQPNVAVYDGKAAVRFGDRSADVYKGEQLALQPGVKLKTESFNIKQEGELYAWSKLRSQYMAEVTGSESQAMVAYNPYWAYGPAWYWDPYFDSWLWGPWGYGLGVGFYGGGFYPGFYGHGFYGHGYYGHGVAGGYHAPVTSGFRAGGFAGGGFHGGFGGGFHGGGGGRR